MTSETQSDEWIEGATPPEIDTQLAELWQEAASLRVDQMNTRLSLAHKLGIRPYYVTKQRREVRETMDELLTLAAEKLADDATTPWEREDIEKAVARWHELVAKLAANREQAKPLEARFDRDQWSRFFLVTNQGGHIHSSMRCSTCYPTTTFNWLPELSGLTEKDAVEAYGPHLCSVCFPSAPVEWTVGTAKDTTNQCPGSATYEYTNFRQTSYTGSGRADCNHCGGTFPVAATRSGPGKLRKHDKPGGDA